ncbi:oxidoreductase [Coccidioides immitis RS]|uniref:Oxidoreductase n=2 Tax=Coccidioides immitis TaxID=5501 RepID=A0A0E1RUX7_COCIM|nr:oxidoreductase [Coccidioides immitis RS]EAS28615.2 oxidoreductase [Coccidioides immitis RS]KMU90591.1 hypothetical protein CIHG_08307 [Coccidioides immitis H538.4]
MFGCPLRFPPFPFIYFYRSRSSFRRSHGSGQTGTENLDLKSNGMRIRHRNGDAVAAATLSTSSEIDTLSPSLSSIHPLMRISLAKLLSNDETELQRLGDACRELGAFYLDLQMTDIGKNIIKDVDKLFLLGEHFFDLSVQEKEKYDMGKFGGYYGYKGYFNRMLDLKEFYAVSKDDILSIPCPRTAYKSKPVLPQPSTIQSARPAIHSYIELSHAIVTILLRHLTTLLHLPVGTLENLHRQGACSGDQVRWIKIQPSQESRINPGDEVLLDEHSDSNSVTVLFNTLGGLEVRQPCHARQASASGGNGADGAPGRWIQAGPLPGHCIIHLGEQIAKLSSGTLRASVHRVCILPDHQKAQTRYSLVYFARPEDKVILQQLEGVSVVPRPGDLTKSSHTEETSTKTAAIARWIKRKSKVC